MPPVHFKKIRLHQDRYYLSGNTALSGFLLRKNTAAPQKLVTQHRRTLYKYEDSRLRYSVLLKEGDGVVLPVSTKLLWCIVTCHPIISFNEKHEW